MAKEKEYKNKSKEKKPNVGKSQTKVKPGDKKKDEDVKQKALNLLKNHPEIVNNARNLFRNENGKTIVEEIVPRGDIRKEHIIYPRNQGDLCEDDLRGLAVYATTLIDKTLSDYDTLVAYEDALSKAIWNKDGGKYANKVNASTFNLILDKMGKIKKAADGTDVLEDVVKHLRAAESRLKNAYMDGIGYDSAHKIKKGLKNIEDLTADINSLRR